MSREFNVLALVKGQERYIFVYDDDSRQPLIEALRDHAADPRLSFSWFDAAGAELGASVSHGELAYLWCGVPL